MESVYNTEVEGIKSQLHSVAVIVHYMLVSRGFKTIGSNESVFHKGPIPAYPESSKLPDMWNVNPTRVVLLYKGNGTYLLVKFTHLMEEVLISLMKHKDERSVEVVLPYESHIGANFSTYISAYVDPRSTIKILQDHLINPFFAGKYSDTTTSHLPPALPGAASQKIISRYRQYKDFIPSLPRFQNSTSYTDRPSPQSTANKPPTKNNQPKSTAAPSKLAQNVKSHVPSAAASHAPSNLTQNVPSHAPSRLPDPFSYGKSDLDPNIGHFSPSGGMVFDPFQQRNRPVPNPQHFPPGSVPPGARFDPTSPLSNFEPDPDEMPRPRFDDHHNI